METHNNFAKYYDFVYEQNFGEFYNILTKNTTDIIQALIPEKATVIDYGAGTGRLSIPLAQLGYKITAVETSEQMAKVLLAKANESNQQIDLQNCSISEFQLNGFESDVALALFTVLSYTTTEQEMKENFRTIFEHLKPGGLFFFDLPMLKLFRSSNFQNSNINRKTDINKLEGTIYTYRDEGSGKIIDEEFEYVDEFQLRLWSEDEIHKLLVECGFGRLENDFSEFNETTGSAYFLYQKLTTNPQLLDDNNDMDVTTEIINRFNQWAKLFSAGVSLDFDEHGYAIFSITKSEGKISTYIYNDWTNSKGLIPASNEPMPKLEYNLLCWRKNPEVPVENIKPLDEGYHFTIIVDNRIVSFVKIIDLVQ